MAITISDVSITPNPVLAGSSCLVEVSASATETTGYYIVFTSTASFSMSLSGGYWDGTVEYSYDGESWATYTAKTTLTGSAIYWRGTGNTRFATSTAAYSRFFFTSSNSVECTGNIENLLDYETVQAGNHPTMANYCFTYLFYSCTSLTTAPALPATTLAIYCYQSMFYGCTGLTTVPALPATKLAVYCYQYMFRRCTNIKLSATETSMYTTPYRIPTSGTGTTTANALSNMFTATGGSFTGTPSINTTYYTSNTVIT